MLLNARRAESPGCELEDERNLNTFAVGRDVRRRCDGVNFVFVLGLLNWTDQL